MPMEELRHLPSPPAAWAGKRLHGINLSGADLRNAQFTLADLTDANLSNANLEHAILGQAFLCRANMKSANLENAFVHQANLVGADLSGARLINTNFGGTSLTDATLANADLTGSILSGTWTTRTDLTHTDLTHAQFLPPELWKAKLFAGETSPKQFNLASGSVDTIGALLERIKEIKGLYEQHDEEVVLYFRGESECGWALRPSVMRRDRLIAAESTMLIDLISRRPQDFVEAPSALAQWVLAQHHGLPTRFLDITSNPLGALYHACEVVEATEPTDGRLHVFAAPRSLVKPFNSDTVSIIANVAKLSRDDQYELVPEPSMIGYPRTMRRLYQLIRAEKPSFDERIDPKDFFRVLIVEPQKSSERIRAQGGALLASMFHVRFERDEILKWNPDTPVYAHYELTVPGDRKEDLRDELRSLGVTREALFPGLDASAAAITEQTMASARPGLAADGRIDVRFAESTSDDS